MSFDRRWLEEVGSEDCQGRALWALGACVHRSKRRDLQFWASELFDLALPGLLETTSPRTWAFGLLGVCHYLERLSGGRPGQPGPRHPDRTPDRVLRRRRSTSDWCWFEEYLAYDNAKLLARPDRSGRSGDHAEALEVGLKTLSWLVESRRPRGGHFRPIGSEGFYRRGHERAQFDQQPVEACATVSACLEAYRATDDTSWLKEARLAFDWFLGSNDLGLELYDAKTGGCCDGLQEDRVNQNQGAESTLAFLLALGEMKLLESILAPSARFRSRSRCPDAGCSHRRPDSIIRQCREPSSHGTSNTPTPESLAGPRRPLDLHRSAIEGRRAVPTRLPAQRPADRDRPQAEQQPGRDPALPAGQRAAGSSGSSAGSPRSPRRRSTCLLEDVMREFRDRHQRTRQFFLHRFEQIRSHLLTDQPLSENRKLLIGAYFTQEYALESAALFNPSMVWHPTSRACPRAAQVHPQPAGHRRGAHLVDHVPQRRDRRREPDPHRRADPVRHRAGARAQHRSTTRTCSPAS